MTATTQCKYSDELISYVYGELEDRDIQQFKVHLNVCSACSEELESFGELRRALGDWKFHALEGFGAVGEPMVQPVRKVSAIAALREFVALSPLWMKAAVGFAALAFCILAVVASGKIQRQPSQSNVTAKTYDENQVKELIDRALAEQRGLEARTNTPPPREVEIKPAPAQRQRQAGFGRPIQSAKTRRPLTKAEREQLAADLRLAMPSGDDAFNLISDKIND